MKLLLLSLALCAWGAPSTHADGISAPGARLQRVADGFTFTEGPACDAEGNVFFTDQPNDRIWRWSVDGKLTKVLEPAGRSNGLCFDAEGKLWACADARNELWCIDLEHSEAPQVKVGKVNGKLLNGPNDLWIRPDGGIYFSDPFYQRDYWKRGPQEQPTMAVFFLPRGGDTPTPVITDFVKPNGLVGTPDGTTLYVSDFGGEKTYRYRIESDGSLSDKQLFCSLGSDGMTLDDEGNVYLTGHGVTVFNPAGQQIEHIDVPEDWTGNICFGGAERQTLFITASKGLYTLATRTRGVGSP